MKGGNNQLTAFGKLVAKALIDQGRTRAELAVEIGTTPQYLSRILRGDRAGGKYIPAIAAALELTAETPAQIGVLTYQMT